MARISTVSGPVNTLVPGPDSPSRSMLSTVARIWQNSSVAPSVSRIATLPVVGSLGPDVPDESLSPPPPQAAKVTNAAAAMLSRATRGNEMLLETGIVPSLMMNPLNATVTGCRDLSRRQFSAVALPESLRLLVLALTLALTLALVVLGLVVRHVVGLIPVLTHEIDRPAARAVL